MRFCHQGSEINNGVLRTTLDFWQSGFLLAVFCVRLIGIMTKYRLHYQRKAETNREHLLSMEEWIT